MQAVKERFVKLLGVGAPEDVAVTPSTSYALSLVAASVHLRPGQQIVVLEAQSASNVMQSGPVSGRVHVGLAWSCVGAVVTAACCRVAAYCAGMRGTLPRQRVHGGGSADGR